MTLYRLLGRHWRTGYYIYVSGYIFVWLIWGKNFIRVNGKGLLLSVTNSIVTVQASEQGGVIKQILVKPGDRVIKNMPLMHMDSDLSIQLNLQKTYWPVEGTTGRFVQTR